VSARVLAREPRLADAAGPHERDEASAFSEERVQVGELRFAPDERRRIANPFCDLASRRRRWTLALANDSLRHGVPIYHGSPSPCRLARAELGARMGVFREMSRGFMTSSRSALRIFEETELERQ
jgi:hypothetical protein